MTTTTAIKIIAIAITPDVILFRMFAKSVSKLISKNGRIRLMKNQTISCLVTVHAATSLNW